MNFFKSIILDDSDPPKSENPDDSDPDSPTKPSQEDHSSDDAAQDGSGWSFGGLIKTLATKSESVIETYSKDLQEFRSGLKKETEIIREAASRAVKDLPASLEAKTSAAHGVLKSTVEIISKEAQAFVSDGEIETPEKNRSLNSGRYSRFDAQLSALQSDLNTFCEEPEDVEEYTKWKSSFKLSDYENEIEDLIGENGSLEGVYGRVVPNEVDDETFWCRYFYRVDKLKQQETVRANLVKRAISADEDDDELSWDVDDDEEKDGDSSEVKTVEKVKGNGESSNPVLNEGVSLNVDDGAANDLVKSSDESRNEGSSLDEREVKSDEKLKSEESEEGKKNENVGTEKGEKGEVSETLNNQEEEDLEWDEIEDIGSDDDKKIATSDKERPNRAEVRKQLNAEDDEDEDLSWDIEDDDEPVKSS